MITLSPYNHHWPQQFEDEKSALQKALGDLASDIQHIGSTAIPGMMAKPVIDILLGVSDLNKITQHEIQKIEDLGYVYQPIFETQLPHRRYFQKTDLAGNRTHQIHLVNVPSSWWNKHILFRNYCRYHPEAAKQYEQHKLTLAKQFDDTLSYAIAKTECCQHIDKLAYFDFLVNHADAKTPKLDGYIPQLACFEHYRGMFQDVDFIRCFGVTLSDDQIHHILTRDTGYWNQYRFGPYAWFSKEDHAFVGEGGLNHTVVDDRHEIELTYSLKKDYWGQGLALEIGRYAIDQAFNHLKLDSLVCFTMVSNAQSLRVMEKLGFEYEKDFTHFNLPHRLYRLSKSML